MTANRRREEQAQSERHHTTSVSAPLAATAVAYGVLLLAYHVKADEEYMAKFAESGEAPFHQRAQDGPFGFSNVDLILFGAFVLMAFELLQFLVHGSGRWLGVRLIPVRGKHLDELTRKHLLFIGLNKLATAPFLYFYLRYCFFERNIIWDLGNITLGIYGYIHKHHHIQKAPSRANVDAVNVHPIEFFLGEYNHLFAVFLCCRCIGLQIHIFGSVLLLAVGGVLAGLNHTRYDIVISILGLRIYDSKAHDVHHRMPQSNYGQYIMFWDFLFGSFRPYDPTDRVNKMSQLDPKTGKSLSYTKNKEKQDL